MDCSEHIGKCRIRLTREEEAALCARMRQGDIAARDRLFESQLPWLTKLASKYARPGLELADLVQVASMALLKALEQFDPTRARLTTYCVRPVKWRLKIEVRKNNLIYRPAIVTQRFAGEHHNAGQIAFNIETLDELLAGGDVADELASAEEYEDQRGRLHDALQKLDPREQRILRRRMAGHTLAMIGADEGLTKERIRQIQAGAVGQLRIWLTKTKAENGKRKATYLTHHS